jgi:apolipoprotein N-acyltransferase
MAAAQCFGWAGWLAVLAPLPLIAALSDSGFLRTWLRLGLFYVVLLSLTLHWIGRTGPGVLWLLPVICVYGTVFLAVPALSLWAAGRHPARLILLPPAWMLMEILERRTLFQLNWTVIGQPLADYPLLAQTASIAGPEALSFLTLAVAVAAYFALTGRSRRARIVACSAGAALAGLTVLFGALRMTAESQPARVRLAVVQPVNPQKLLWTPVNRKPLLDRMNKLIDQAASLGPRMIVLPETAVQGLVRYDKDLTAFVRNAVIRTGLPLLFGAIDYDRGKYSNVAILITPYNTVTTYRKIHLVPFIEYRPRGFPYSAPVGWLRYTPGTERMVFALRGGPSFAAVICLEDTLPDLAREFANNRARVLVALVNTESFLDTSQPLQHLRRARLTAIASGLPVVRAANSGISASIDCRGRVLGRIEEGVPRAAILLVGDPAVTLYVQMGDGPVVVLLVVVIAGVVLILRKPHWPPAS